MCEHGTITLTNVHVDASIAHEGRDIFKPMPIDSCIADMIAKLDANGLRMLATCCGHGTLPALITLADGSSISIPTTEETPR